MRSRIVGRLIDKCDDSGFTLVEPPKEGSVLDWGCRAGLDVLTSSSFSCLIEEEDSAVRSIVMAAFGSTIGTSSVMSIVAEKSLELWLGTAGWVEVFDILRRFEGCVDLDYHQ